MIGRPRRRPRLGSGDARAAEFLAADRDAAGRYSHHGAPRARHARHAHEAPRASPRPSRRLAVRRLAARAAAFLAATVLAVLLVRFAAGVASGLPFFEVDEVHVEGAVYLTRDEVRTAAGVASGANLWDSKSGWVEGIESHPLIAAAEVRRRFPSTLLVSVEEVTPVALTAAPLVEAVDATGAPIPVDPTNPVLDLPLLRVPGAGADSAAASQGVAALAGEIERVGALAPEVFSVVSEAHWEDGLVTLFLGDSGPRIRYRPPLSGSRLREGVVVMNDALERFPERPPQEVDLRFDGQVVVRSGEPAATGDEPAASSDDGATGSDHGAASSDDGATTLEGNGPP